MHPTTQRLWMKAGGSEIGGEGVPPRVALALIAAALLRPLLHALPATALLALALGLLAG